MQTNIGNADYSVTHDVDAYEDHADDLMDDLFGDVEHILSVDGQTKLARMKPASNFRPQKIEPEPTENLVAAQTLSLTKIDLPSMTLPPVSEQEILWVEPYMPRQQDYAASRARQSYKQAQAKSGKFLDRLLLGAACGSALLSAFVWAMVYGLPGSRRAIAQAPTPSQLNPETAKFADEVRRSLATADSRPAAAPTTTPVAAPMLPNGQTLPGILAPLSPGGIQYVPVYPVYQQPIPVPGTPGVTAAPISPVLSSPVAAAMTTPTYTLSGVLDLGGDRSSILVSVDGSVQTVRLGEPISNSGWTLSRVSKQEAFIKRGSEIKALIAGQKF
jgi:hypothetical protein